MKTFFRVILFVLIFLAGIAALGFYWTFYRPLPNDNIQLEMPELSEKVDIHWESYGVPHIYAANEKDLYYALGYVHARDRLWQMTLSQMASQGRFAEFLGKDLLPYDLFQRTIGFWRIAQRLEEQLSPHSKQILQAYSEGVNSFIQKHPDKLPVQFALADMNPIPWTPTHTLALGRLMAWELNMAWKAEITYSYLLNHLPEEHSRELFPSFELYSQRNTTSSGQNKKLAQSLIPLLEYDDGLKQLMGSQGSRVGSNAWAVSSEKTHTDYPLLAGDPHLGLSMPGKWYEVHLNLDGRNLAGATLPGAPAVILGQNDHLAWSLTNLMVDDTDFYEEILHPEDSTQYLLDTLGGEPVYTKFEIEQEVINIRNADDTLFTRKSTKHGPVISEIYPAQELLDDRVVAMRWTGQDTTGEFDALLGMDWAESLEEFLRAAHDFKVPGQNIIYADKYGNIAHIPTANIPRRSGNPYQIRKGWKPENDWLGYVSYGEIPITVNPDNGWVANANNPPFGSDFPYYVSIYWEPDSRYNRIRQYLTQTDILTPEIYRVMQNDSYSDYAREMLGHIMPVLREASIPQFETPVSYLENWDYRYELSETAASLMDVFLVNLSKNTFRDEMGEAAYNQYIRFSAHPERTLLRFMQNGSRFFDDVDTPETETKEEIIIRSMNESLVFLKQTFGPEPFEWRWEQLHTLTLAPPLFGEAANDPGAPRALKLIVDNLLSEGPFPVKGHDMSLNNGEYRWTDPYKMVLGPSIRRIIDFSTPGRSLSILPTGQSERPLSSSFGDQTDSWLNGQYKYLYQDSTFFEENQYKTTILLPGR